ncbi:MAG: tRNA (adenosine(37)-N6)-dimethylallyltransferase MiaA [Bacillota bacterium]
MDERQRLLVIVGPTAVGKSDLAMRLARRFRGEVVSADSMQVYLGMDIGTAKIAPGEMRGVPHHMIDILPPTERFSAGRFKALARPVIDDIAGRGLLPLLVGGTALYVRALLYDYPLARVDRDPELRSLLRNRAGREGPESLHSELARIDPDSARRIHPNDVRRVIRAIEVWHRTGRTMTEWRGDTPAEPAYNALKIGLCVGRDLLYRRIDRRVDEMIARGLVEEVRGLLNEYGQLSFTAAQALGYREVIEYLRGGIDLGDCILRIKKNTRNFAKRQLTWFRADGDIEWIDAASDGVFQQASRRVSDWLD